MKKSVVLLMLIMLAVSIFVPAFAEDPVGPFQRVALELGTGLSFGMIDEGSEDEYGDTLALATFLLTLRGAAHLTARFRINQFLSFGSQAGVYAISYEPTEGDVFTLIDIPVRSLVRLDLRLVALEAFGGYYLTVQDSGVFNCSGLEAGGKLFFGNFYASYSLVLADPKFKRIEAGFQLRDMLKF